LADDGGLSRLQKRLAAIPEKVRDGIRPAMEKSAQEIVDAAKSLVPVETGHLRDSIGWTWGAAPSGSITIATGPVLDSLQITIYAGDDDAFYARWVEFGTRASTKGARVSDSRTGGTRKANRTHSGTHAQPFFYPAFRLYKKRAANRVKRAIRTSVKQNWGTP
jgi:HK97 gp10 family phage protein